MSQWGPSPSAGQPTGQPGPWGVPAQPAAPPAPSAQPSQPPAQPNSPWGVPTAAPQSAPAAPGPQATPYPHAQPGPAPYGQPAAPPQPMPVVTTHSIPGRQVQSSLGEVIGVAIREREIGRKEDPLVAYPALLLRSRQQAVAAMVEQARQRGADAVVGLLFDSSEITQSLSEVVAYGTAVRLS